MPEQAAAHGVTVDGLSDEDAPLLVRSGGRGALLRFVRDPAHREALRAAE